MLKMLLLNEWAVGDVTTKDRDLSLSGLGEGGYMNIETSYTFVKTYGTVYYTGWILPQVN